MFGMRGLGVLGVDHKTQLKAVPMILGSTLNSILRRFFIHLSYHWSHIQLNTKMHTIQHNRSPEKQPLAFFLLLLVTLFYSPISAFVTAGGPHNSPFFGVSSHSSSPPTFKNKSGIFSAVLSDNTKASANDSNNNNNNNNSSNNNSPKYSNKPIKANFVAETKLPTHLGDYKLRAYRCIEDEAQEQPKTMGQQSGLNNPFSGKEPVVIYKDDGSGGVWKKPSGGEVVPVRLHDQCFTSEVLGSQRCDCKDQLELAMSYINENGGIIIYLQQEGRGIGLANKIAAYALQDSGMDTVDANLHLGFDEDCRSYGVIPSILDDLGIKKIALLTNNPFKVEKLRDLKVEIVKTVPMLVNEPGVHNRRYLQTKVDRMNHGVGNVGDENLMKKMMMVGGGSTSTSTSTSSVDSDIAVEGVSANSNGYCFGRNSVLSAVRAIKRGELVCVVDDMEREVSERASLEEDSHN